MRIAYQIKAKNGALWEAALTMGGVAALAEHLGLKYQYLITLMNMRAYPGFKRKGSAIDWAAVEHKLLHLTGLTLDEIFPDALGTSEFMARPKVHTVLADVQPEQLTAAHERLALPPPQEKIDLKHAVALAVGRLKEREADIVKRLFGLEPYEGEQSLREVAQHYNISPCRVGQIQATALRRLRHPALALRHVAESQ